MAPNKKVYVAGHNGMVGGAIVRCLSEHSDIKVITAGHDKIDLCDQSNVRSFFMENKFDEVYLAAAKVGGIYANNTFPAEFIYNNIMIEANVIEQSFRSGVKKLIFLGSSCIYPKYATQPIREIELLSGVLEPTNEPYAIAKIAGIKLCESYNRQYNVDYRSVMPTNLYGENDNFHLENSHVIPALIRKFHDAKLNKHLSVEVWGTGNAKREFLYVDDMAGACVHLMNVEREHYSSVAGERLSHVNVGTGVDCSIQELAETIRDVVGYDGIIRFNHNKPDGAPRKVLDVGKMSELGWKYTVSLKEGLRKTYSWFLENENNFRGK